MSKFNRSSESIATTNLAGGKAYKITNERLLLATKVLTSFFGEPKFYTPSNKEKELLVLIRKMAAADPEFVSQLAIYSREVYNLRSISHVLSAELAHSSNGKAFARKTIGRVIKRPDDATEIFAYYVHNFGRPIPNSLKKGINDAFVKFDEYQLGKYNRDNAVKLRDLILMTRPKPQNSVQADLWKRLLEGKELETPYTWETELSTKGNNKETWEALVDSRRMGYMATLRNLRNIINSGAENLQQVIDYISNPTAIKNSKQFPYRFLSAYREIQKLGGFNGKLLQAVGKALDLSAENLTTLPGKTYIMTDMSGSMKQPVSKKGTVMCQEIAILMSALAAKISDDSIIGLFGEDMKNVTVYPDSPVITNYDALARVDVGHATYAHKPLQWLIDNKIKVDRILLFSDMQCYSERPVEIWSWREGRRTVAPSTQSLLERYRREVNADVWVHSFDLTGYGTAQFVGKNTNLVGGWSDKALDFILMAEQGFGGVVEAIQNHQ